MTDKTTDVVTFFSRAIDTEDEAGSDTITDDRAVPDIGIALTRKTADGVFTGNFDATGHMTVVQCTD